MTREQNPCIVWIYALGRRSICSDNLAAISLLPESTASLRRFLNFSSILSAMCAAASSVKVTTSILSTESLPLIISSPILAVNTVVLPEPADAETRLLLSPAFIIFSCSAENFITYPSFPFSSVPSRMSFIPRMAVLSAFFMLLSAPIFLVTSS